MIRILVCGMFLLGLIACRLPPDRTPLKPLPEDDRVFSYDEILSRARAQATVALEAFYIDNWSELAEAAEGLTQTARFLPRTSEVPAKHRGSLASEAGALKDEAIRLREAARLKDVTAANDALQKINLKIRRLRSEAEVPSSRDRRIPSQKPAAKPD
jgi:hypothetical protein